MKIYSVQNPKIKNLKKITKKNFFLVEGTIEFEMAIKGNYNPIKIFIYKKIFSRYDLISSYKSNVIYVNKNVYKKLAYRKNSNGIVSLFQEKPLQKLKNVKIFNKNNYLIIIILDGIEKPGNIGAILRVSESIGAYMVILCNVKTYIFNPNIIRCSLGSVFTNKIFIEKKSDFIIYWLKKNMIKIFVSGFNKNAVNLYKTKFSCNKYFSVVFGSENKGVSKKWIKEANKIINIPMFGKINSLNVSHSMSIISYEIIRQIFYN